MGKVMYSAPVLIIEDDVNTSKLVSTYLEKEGFETVCVADGAEALQLAEKTAPGFVILDVMLPGVDGWDICRALRKKSDVPILMLTAREEEIDRIMGLSLGADDYVVKPFSPRELVERVKAILRRSQQRPERMTEVLQINGLTLDPEKCMVKKNKNQVNLTTSEYKLLHTLMSSPGRVFSRQALLDRLYEQGESVIERVVDVHLGKLRQKIEDDPSNPKLVITVRGFGYRFAEPGESVQ